MVRIREEWDYPDGEPSRDFKEMFDRRFNKNNKQYDNFQTMLEEFADWQYRRKPVVTKNQKKSLAWVAEKLYGIKAFAEERTKKGQIVYREVKTGKFVNWKGEITPKAEKTKIREVKEKVIGFKQETIKGRTVYRDNKTGRFTNAKGEFKNKGK